MADPSPAGSENDRARQALAALRVHAAHMKEVRTVSESLARTARAHVRKLGLEPAEDETWPALATASEIMRTLARDLREKVMHGLPEDIRRQLAERLFSFQSITRHPDVDVQALIRATGNRTLAIALLGAGEDIVESVKRNMSKRAAAMLEEDMQSVERSEELSVRDVREARREIGETFFRMAELGELGTRQDG